jgi:hypothetical protein
MGSAVAGLLATNSGNQVDLSRNADLVGEYQRTILIRNAKGMNVGTTLFGLMSRLKTENAENTEFSWFERDPLRRTLYVKTANPAYVTSDGASSTIDRGDTSDVIVMSTTADGTGTEAWKYLDKGTVLYNMTTGEYIQVRDTPTTDTVKTYRRMNYTDAQIGTGATPGTGASTYVLLAGDPLVIVTLGKDEGTGPVRAKFEEPDLLTNYIQTFNSAVNLTNAFKGQKLRTDQAGPLRQRRLQALESIAKDIELAYLLGTKVRKAGSNGYEYYTGGIKGAIEAAGLSANALLGTGTVTLAAFNEWLRSFMVYGSDAKLALAGPSAYAAISTFANSATNGFRIMNQETVWGMNITTINTPFGVLDLAFHPLLQEIPSFVTWMFVVDLAMVVQKSMEPLFLEPNIQLPGTDKYEEQFRAKLGLKLKFANAFGYAKGLGAISAT